MSSVTGQFLSTISAILILYIVGGNDVLKGEMTLGELVAFGNNLGWAVGPILALSKMTSHFSRLKNSYERIQEVFNEKKEIGLENKFKITTFSNSIEIKNLSFDYGRTENVIENLNLTIKKGQSIAFVGSSGCGKTTLINLILKIFKPKNGEITFDGINITEINNKSLRNVFGVVSQDTILFDDTIEKNLTMFSNKNISYDQIEKATHIAQIKEFIESLPNKYQTYIGENGVKLSGGQKQRLAIARTILYQPEIFIFDEATSNLDSESEKLFQKSLNEIMKEKTTIIIAHRLSTIVNCDKIYVMDEGKIVESGSHRDLLKTRGVYYSFWKDFSDREIMQLNSRIKIDLWEKLYSVYCGCQVYHPFLQYKKIDYNSAGEQKEIYLNYDSSCLIPEVNKENQYLSDNIYYVNLCNFNKKQLPHITELKKLIFVVN